MNELKVTWSRAGRVFLAYLWRFFAMTVAIAVTIGLAIVVLLDVETGWIETAFGTVLVLAAYVFAGIWAMRRVLKADFGEFRVTLVEPFDRQRLRELEEAEAQSVGRE